MDEKLVLGIEGGGTKTDWIYERRSATQTHILSEGQLAAANLRLITDQTLLDMLGCLPPQATHVGVFLAGCITQDDKMRLESLSRRIWPGARIAVGSDRDSSFAAAFGSGNGIVVISGTGSAVTGHRDGKIEKAGGRGHLLGDRGGAYVICIEGLRLVLRVYDLRHRTTPLAQNILRALSLNRMEDLVSWTQSADKTSIARLAPVLFEGAQQGDAKMLAIITRGARHLAQYTASVARRLKLKSPPVKLLGGMFTHQPVYVQLYRDALSRILPEATVDLCAETGAAGAAWLAAGTEPGSPIVANALDEPSSELAAAPTEQPNPRSANLDQLSVAELIDVFVHEEAYVVDALHACRQSLQAAVELATEVLRGNGRLFYVGAGTSGRLGVLDASEIPPTFGESPERIQGIIAGGYPALYSSVEGAEDDTLQGTMAITERGVSSRDVVCGIAASGRTPFVLSALQQAKRIGAKTILLTCNPDRKRSVSCDVEIDLPTGPELLTGSTRLKAGTATKVALNILSTCCMIRLGKVLGNWMIDLRASNAKLQERAIRLVCRLRHCSAAEARQILERNGWNVRAALAKL